MSENKPQKPRIQTAARTVEILQAVARAGSVGISAKMLSETLSLPRQVVYHLTHTLVALDMLRKIGGNYVLGLGVGALVEGFRRHLLTPDLMRHAQEAARVTGETAYVVGWHDGEIVALASAKGVAAIHAAEIPQGTAGDAHARASGKLLLAMASSEELGQYLKGRQLRRRTPNTIVSRATLQRQLAVIRKTWVAIDNEEYGIGLSCMAVPIGTPPSQLVLGISAPTDRFRRKRAEYLTCLRRIGRAAVA